MDIEKQYPINRRVKAFNLATNRHEDARVVGYTTERTIYGTQVTGIVVEFMPPYRGRQTWQKEDIETGAIE